jgi:hypothetical protein
MRKRDRLQKAQNQAGNQAHSVEKAPAKKSGGLTPHTIANRGFAQWKKEILNVETSAL